MLTSTRTTLIALPVAIAALAAAGPAGATLPAPKTTLVVFGKSVGGAKLGGSLSSAKAAWGSGRGSCDKVGDDEGCLYRAAGDFSGAKGEGYIQSSGGRVTQIQLTAPGTGGRRLFSGPLMKLKTAKGIGLGSTLKSLRKAYPSAKRTPGTTAAWEIGSGAGRTQFDIPAKSGRVERIFVGRGG